MQPFPFFFSTSAARRLMLVPIYGVKLPPQGQAASPGAPAEPLTSLRLPGLPPKCQKPHKLLFSM